MEQNSTTQQTSTQPTMQNSTSVPQQNSFPSPSTKKTQISSLTEDLSNMKLDLLYLDKKKFYSNQSKNRDLLFHLSLHCQK